MPLLRRRAVLEDPPGPGRVSIAKTDQDHFLTAIMTWIPIEVIGVYKFVMGFIPLDYPSWRLGLTIVIWCLTPLWIGFATKPNNRKIAWRQVIIAPVAFILWIAAIQGDVVAGIFAGWQAWMGSVFIGVGTLLLPMLDGILRRFSLTQN